ncbi:MAG: PEP-CTERM sorting domain-containing protein [Verrucomicrobiota bacterium JB022]|nr:PEP-CTERM sorting domain-containing protein [Verrucomicrobiota bacterium JB022]
MNKLTSLSAASLAVTSASFGAIVLVDVVPDLVISQGQDMYIDFDTQTASLDVIDGFDVRLFIAAFDVYLNPEQSWLVSADSSSFPYVLKFSQGSDLTFANPTSNNNSQISYDNLGYWETETSLTLGYAALTDGSNEAWLELNYDPAANTLGLTRFAYSTNGEQLTAGVAPAPVVPEPSTTAAIAALLAGSAALYKRRRDKAAA